MVAIEIDAELPAPPEPTLGNERWQGLSQIAPGQASVCTRVCLRGLGTRNAANLGEDTIVKKLS